MERYQVVGHLRLDPEGTVTSYADAQATVEALQRERDEWKERAEAHDEDHLIINSLNEQVAFMKTQLAEGREALDAEREKVKGQTQRAEYAEGKVCELLLKQDAIEAGLMQLKALVRALPKCEGTVFIEQSKAESVTDRWRILVSYDHAGVVVAECRSQQAAEAVLALLKYRATMDTKEGPQVLVRGLGPLRW